MKKDIITLDYSMARDMILNYPCAFPYLTIVPQDFIRMMTECSQHVAFKSETSIEDLFENVHSMLLSLTDHLNNSSHGILVIQGDYSSIRAFPSQTHIATPDVIEKMTSFI